MNPGTRRFRPWSISIGVAAVVLSAGPAWADLSNGSFETGLTDWTFVRTGGGTASAVPGHSDPTGTGTTSWAPTDGGSFALLKTDGPDSYQQLYQTLTVSAGDVLTLDYFWDSRDTTGDNDVAAGRIYVGAAISGIPLATLFEHSVNNDPQNAWGTDWTSVAPYTFASSGTYTLWFGIANGHNAIDDSYIGIDKVVLTPVPLPAAAILGILGLGVAGLRLRKFV